MRKTPLLIALLASVLAASAHPMPATLVELTVGPGQLVFDIKIPLANADSVVFAASEGSQTLPASPLSTFSIFEKYLANHLKVTGTDGAAWPTSLFSLDTIAGSDQFSGSFPELHARVVCQPPPGADSRQFLLFYDVIIHQIVTHEAIVGIRQDWENGIHSEPDSLASTVAVIRVEPETGEVLPVAVNLEKGSLWKGVAAMFRLGMRHIAEGYDHLLFLLALLLPAPLMASRRRWEGFGGARHCIVSLVKITAAFTLGHSLTLAAGAVGWLRLPSRPVEVFIAVSILISAIHALRPLFAGREAWVAAGFGLVHGLAFAAILSNLGLDAGRLAWSILGFNLGIEAMQLAVVAAALPVLLFLGKTRFYPAFRVAGAVAAGILSLIWIWERLG